MKRLFLLILILVPILAPGQIKLSQLNEATSINTTDLFLLTQGAASKKLQYTNLKYSLFNSIPYPLRLNFLTDTTRINHSGDSTKFETSNSYFVFNKKIKAPLFLVNTDTCALKPEVRSLIGDTAAVLRGLISSSSYNFASWLDDVDAFDNDGIYMASQDANCDLTLSPQIFSVGTAQQSVGNNCHIRMYDSTSVHIQSQGAAIRLGSGKLVYDTDYSSNWHEEDSAQVIPDKGEVYRIIDNSINQDTTKINHNDTINGSGSGDIATRHYVDSISNRTIKSNYQIKQTGTVETIMYSDTIEANKIRKDGDMIIANYSGTINADLNNEQEFYIYFSSVQIASASLFTNFSESETIWKINVMIMRVSSSAVNAIITTTSGTTSSSAVVKLYNGAATGLNFSADIILKLTSKTKAAGAAGDIYGEIGHVEYKPAN